MVSETYALNAYVWCFFFASREFHLLLLFDYDILTCDESFVKVNDFLAPNFHNQCDLTQYPQMDKDEYFS